MKILASAVLVTVLFLAPAAMAGSCGGAAHTHSPKEMANHYFDKMDLNGDKVVTKEEFEKSKMQKMVKSFDALEPNESGVVTKSAFIQTMVKMHPETKNEA